MVLRLKESAFSQVVYRRISDGITARLSSMAPPPGRKQSPKSKRQAATLRSSQQFCYNMLVKAEARSANPLSAFHLLNQVCAYPAPQCVPGLPLHRQPTQVWSLIVRA